MMNRCSQVHVGQDEDDVHCREDEEDADRHPEAVDARIGDVPSPVALPCSATCSEVKTSLV